MRERWGVEPAQIPDVLALMGDSIDNIPGVHGRRREDRGQAHRPVRRRRRACTRTSRWCRASCARRWPPAASRRCSRASWRRVSTRGAARRSTSRRSARRSRTGTKLRALWMEIEFTRLLKELPAAPAAAVSAEPVAALADARGARRLPGEGARGRRRSPSTGPATARPPRPALDGARPLPSRRRAPRSLDGAAAGGALPDFGGRAADRCTTPSRCSSAWLGARRHAAGRRGHRAGRLSAQPGARPTTARGGVRGAARRVAAGAPAPPGQRARRWRLASALVGAWHAARAQTRSGSARSTRTSSGRWCRCSPTMERARHPRRSGAPRGVRQGARARPRQPRRARSTRSPARSSRSPRPSSSRTILFEKLKLPPLRRTKTGYSTDADVLEQLAPRPPAARQDPRAPHARQAQGHLRRRAARAGQPADRPHPHHVQPARGGDGAARRRRIRTSEHPDPHRAGPAHPRGVRARGGLAVRGRRLLADRAAHPRPRLGRGEPRRGLPARRGHPHAARRAEVFGSRSTRRDVRCSATIAKTANFAVIYGVTAFGLSPAHEDRRRRRRSEYIDAYFARASAGAGVHRRARWRRAASAATSSTLLGRRRYLPELRSGNPNLARLRRAHGDERAGPGHRQPT